MPKYRCSFGYNVPYFTDFIVKATSIKEAQKIIDLALSKGKFKKVEGLPDFDSIQEERVFVMGIERGATWQPSLQQLLAEAEENN